jgi:hypothetical protein
MAATIAMSHPPEALLRAVNPTLRAALRLPLLGSSLKDFMVVEFTGRKSGRHFSVPVSAHHLDGELYVILAADWKHNFAGGASATVLHAGKKTSMHGLLVKEPGAVAGIVHRVATGYGAKKAQRSMGLKFGSDTVPSLEEFTEATKRLKIAAIRLTPA